MQRIDDKLRPHSIGTFGVYGEPKELEQIGVIIWRGKDIPPMMMEHPQFEYWKKEKLDVSKPEIQQLVYEYLSTKEEGKVEGRTVQSH